MRVEFGTRVTFPRALVVDASGIERWGAAAALRGADSEKHLHHAGGGVLRFGCKLEVFARLGEPGAGPEL